VVISTASIDTDDFSARLRVRAVDRVSRRVLVAMLRDSAQEADLSEPTNCGGIGRIRHFQRQTRHGWPSNPLPVDPACQALGIPPAEQLRAQVFQNAACNWRCWYCYVPYGLLSANSSRGLWLTADELLDRWAAVSDCPPVVVLSGGQPDLTPEWVPWMLAARSERGLNQKLYLWSDDNLSTDYFWRYLNDAEQELVATAPCYGRVCCFKGFDPESFAFNTHAAPELFDRQFQLFARLLAAGMDLYAYATFTTPSTDRIADKIARFMDRLQDIAANLPLRTVPLEIQV